MNTKAIALAILIGFALTGLTYFYASPVPMLRENDPFFWYYSVISVTETSTSSPAILRGFPFSYVLESKIVYMFGLFAFILDFIIYLIIGILIVWLMFKSSNKQINAWFSVKSPVRKKMRRV